MNRRLFLRSSGLATGAFGAFALRLSPHAAGEIARNLATPEMTPFTVGQTVCSILIANELAGRSRASDWELLGVNIRAIESFWANHNLDSVVVELLSPAVVADLTPALLNLKAVLREVQALHPGATSSELYHAADFLDQVSTTLKHEMLSNLQQHGFLPYIQQARISAGRIAVEMRGFTASTRQATYLHGGDPLRQKTTLSNAPESITLAGMIFATLSVLRLPQGWHPVADWGASAAVAAGMAARSFAVNGTSLTG